MTPIQIELLLKVYYLAEPQDVAEWHTKAGINAVSFLKDRSLIDYNGESYSITARGLAFVEYIINLPLPVRRCTWEIEV